jgi:hypothetical protein
MSIIAPVSPVCVLTEFYLRYIEPDGGYSETTGFQVSIYLLYRGIMVAQAVVDETGEGVGKLVIWEEVTLSQNNGRKKTAIVT